MNKQWTQEQHNARFDDIFGIAPDEEQPTDDVSLESSLNRNNDTPTEDSHIEVEMFEPETGKTYIALIPKDS